MRFLPRFRQRVTLWLAQKLRHLCLLRRETLERRLNQRRSPKDWQSTSRQRLKIQRCRPSKTSCLQASWLISSQYYKKSISKHARLINIASPKQHFWPLTQEPKLSCLMSQNSSKNTSSSKGKLNPNYKPLIITLMTFSSSKSLVTASFLKLNSWMKACRWVLIKNLSRGWELPSLAPEWMRRNLTTSMIRLPASKRRDLRSASKLLSLRLRLEKLIERLCGHLLSCK